VSDADKAIARGFLDWVLLNCADYGVGRFVSNPDGPVLVSQLSRPDQHFEDLWQRYVAQREANPDNAKDPSC